MTKHKTKVTEYRDERLINYKDEDIILLNGQYLSVKQANYLFEVTEGRIRFYQCYFYGTEKLKVPESAFNGCIIREATFPERN